MQGCVKREHRNMRRVFCIQSARSCCVSFEVAQFLPLFFTARVSIAELLFNPIILRDLTQECRKNL